eukprot:2559364-Pyramimonas_sp.AAC.1
MERLGFMPPQTQAMISALIMKQKHQDPSATKPALRSIGMMPGRRRARVRFRQSAARAWERQHRGGIFSPSSKSFHIRARFQAKSRLRVYSK